LAFSSVAREEAEFCVAAELILSNWLVEVGMGLRVDTTAYVF